MSLDLLRMESWRRARNMTQTAEETLEANSHCTTESLGSDNTRSNSRCSTISETAVSEVSRTEEEESHQCNGNSHQSRALLVQEEQIRLLVATQEETFRVLSDMSSAIRDLKSSIDNNFQSPTKGQTKRRLSRKMSDGGGIGNRWMVSDPLMSQPKKWASFELSELDLSMETKRRLSRKMSDGGGIGNRWRVSDPLMSQPKKRASFELSELDLSMDDESAIDDELGFDRKQVRLDGIEVYAVVSAVTAGTLVAVFDSYHPGDMMDLYLERRYLEVFMSTIFLATGTIGIVCSLHCIFVFSLVTMYGRTALGMERDEALELFFADTGLQRIHGFRTFVGSLYSLMCQLIVVVTSKVSNNPWVIVAVFGMTGRLMFYVHNDVQLIMDKATVIFDTSLQQKIKSDVQPQDIGTRDVNDSISSRNEEKQCVTDRKKDSRKSRKTCMNMPASALVGANQPMMVGDDSDSISSGYDEKKYVTDMKKNKNRKSYMIMPATAMIGFRQNRRNTQ